MSASSLHGQMSKIASANNTAIMTVKSYIVIYTLAYDTDQQMDMASVESPQTTSVVTPQMITTNIKYYIIR